MRFLHDPLKSMWSFGSTCLASDSLELASFPIPKRFLPAALMLTASMRVWSCLDAYCGINVSAISGLGRVGILFDIFGGLFVRHVIAGAFALGSWCSGSCWSDYLLHKNTSVCKDVHCREIVKLVNWFICPIPKSKFLGIGMFCQCHYVARPSLTCVFQYFAPFMSRPPAGQ